MLDSLLKLDNPIFIVGCPRSGTTKLSTILNRHSCIASATETHFFNFVSKQKFNWKNFSVQEFKRLLKESRIEDFTNLAGLNPEYLIEQFAQIENLSNDSALIIEDFNKKKVFDLLVKNYLIKKNKIRFCEKTPQHIQNIGEILQIYPQAKIILMVRDGRDTVNSLLKMPWRPKGLLNNARFWSYYVKLGKQASLRPEVLTIKYENLLNRPQDVLITICNFIGENFEDALLDDSKDTDILFSPWEASWKHKSKHELDSSRINAWSRELNSDDKAILNWFLNKDLLELGYQSESLKLTFTQSCKIATQYFNIVFKKISRLIADVTN